MIEMKKIKKYFFSRNISRIKTAIVIEHTIEWSAARAVRYNIALLTKV